MSADRYAVVGNPIAHSRSPWIHARFAALTDQHLHYERIELPLDGFADGIARLRAQGFAGCNVTVPFKAQAAATATLPSDAVRRAGAANTLVFRGGHIEGHNTDGLGLVADIEVHAGVALQGTRVALLGAGGAAAGVLAALLARAPRSVTVFNRTLARADALVAAHRDVLLSNIELQSASGCRQSAENSSKQMWEWHEQPFDILINATASSLGGEPLELTGPWLRQGACVVDMMYGPKAQPFLDQARALGGVPRDGLGMLVEQAASAFEIWRGVRPPTAAVLAELRARVNEGLA
jgi:shikimate dehydrogenase